jgi:ketosteroid isomerase-like protein
MRLLRLDIEALNAEFAYLIDHYRSDAVADLFTEDGVYGRSTGEVSAGREAIRESYRRRSARGPRTARHIFTNLRLTVKSDGRVRGQAILLLFAGDGPPPLPAEPMIVADYDDIYERGADGRWRYRERIITWIFQRPDAKSPLQLGGAG